MATSRTDRLVRASSKVDSASVRGLFPLTRVASNLLLEPKPELQRQETELRKRDALKRLEKGYSFWVKFPVQSTLEQLGVDPKQGLSTHQAAEKLAKDGRNELEKDPPKSIWRLLFDQLTDILVLMLITSAIVSAALGEYPAAVSILVIVSANAALGVFQEHRAGAALDALESVSAPIAEVIRDGRTQKIDSMLLVVGDVVTLASGQRIPADIRLIETQGLQVNEMPLTGESASVNKDANAIVKDEPKSGSEHKQAAPQAVAAPNKDKDLEMGLAERKEGSGGDAHAKEAALTDPNMVYMGCSIVDGRGTGVVVKTGMKTKMGEIAHLLKTAEAGQSPLQKKLGSLGVRLGLMSIAVSIVVFIIGVTTGRGTVPGDPNPRALQMLLIAVSLTVAAVPEGLPTCVTITLAIGMRRMLQKRALIRNLHSVETLGSASVICTDKTGTLTKGEMTAKRMWFRGQTYTFTKGGFDPTGTVIPEGVAENQSEQELNAIGDRIKGGEQEVPIMVAALCSDANVQFENLNEDKDDEPRMGWRAFGNMSDVPMVVASLKAGFEAKQLSSESRDYERVALNAFNSARKMMSTIVKVNSPNAPPALRASYVACVKGAPNVVLTKCSKYMAKDAQPYKEMTENDRNELLNIIDGFSAQAFRVLAVAFRTFDQQPSEEESKAENLESELVFAGLMCIIDPEREAVPDSIAKAAQAGIRTVMITGDYVITAKAIGENIGLLPPHSSAGKAIDCAIVRELGTRVTELEEENKTASKDVIKKNEAEIKSLEKRLDEITAFADVYARAKPVDKITIVRSLQRQGHVCSMTGDGVNDAPALRQANIGVAMGITGTDVAKSASDMVLTDDNFCSIVDAVEEGRTIYLNISKFVFYLLSTNTAEVMLILLAVIIGLPSPLTPLQILYLNLVTDGAPAIALALEQTEPGLMTQGPRKQNESIVDRFMMVGVMIQMITLTAVTLGVYIWGLYWHTGTWDASRSGILAGSPADDDIDFGVRKAQTMTILTIVIAELLRAYSSRTLRASLFEVGVFSNKYMQYACGVSLGLTMIVVHVPGVMDLFDTEYLGGRDWGLIIGMSFIPFTIDEITKCVYRATDFGRRPTVTTAYGAAAAGPSAKRPSVSGRPHHHHVFHQHSKLNMDVEMQRFMPKGEVSGPYPDQDRIQAKLAAAMVSPPSSNRTLSRHGQLSSQDFDEQDRKALELGGFAQPSPRSPIDVLQAGSRLVASSGSGSGSVGPNEGTSSSSSSVGSGAVPVNDESVVSIRVHPF